MAYGAYASLTIGADGLPVIAYIGGDEHGITSYYLKVAHCNDIPCDAPSINKVLEDEVASTPGFVSTSITIGSNGLPILSHDTSEQIHMVNCSNQFCVPYWRRR